MPVIVWRVLHCCTHWGFLVYLWPQLCLPAAAVARYAYHWFICVTMMPKIAILLKKFF